MKRIIYLAILALIVLVIYLSYNFESESYVEETEYLNHQINKS